MRVEWTEEVVSKVAESDADRARLEEEAAVLRAVAHPAVVRLARLEGGGRADEPFRLVLHRIAGRSLDQLEPQPAATVAAWGAAAATVLADLHDLGYVHGDVSADCLLLDYQGRLVLCGFGHARRPGRPEGRGPFDADVAALAHLVLDRLPPGERRLRRRVSRWADGRSRFRPGARALALTLAQATPAGEPGDAAPRRLPAPKAVAVAAGLAVLALGSWAIGSWAAGSWAVAAGSRAAGPAITRPGTRTVVPAYVLRSAPGEDPVTVVGRWRCGPPRPAVLDSASGTIWTFPAWPAAGQSSRARYAGQVRGAVGLGVSPAGPGCDRLVALRAGAADVAVDVGPLP